MNEELTRTEIDAELDALGVSERWRAGIEGYSVVYGLVSPDSKKYTALVTSLLKLRAVIQAIDDSGTSAGVPLRNYHVPLLASEYAKLQADAGPRVTGKKSGRAGKDKPRNARSYAIRAAFDMLGVEAEIDAVVEWLEEETCYIVYEDGVDTFAVDGYKTVTCTPQVTRNAISKLASAIKSKK